MHILHQLCYSRFTAGLRKSTDRILTLIVREEVSPMKKSDVICPESGAGYRRIELIIRPGDRGELRCLMCDHLLETFDGARTVTLRLTVQSERRTWLWQHTRSPRMPAPVLMASPSARGWGRSGRGRPRFAKFWQD